MRKRDDADDSPGNLGTETVPDDVGQPDPADEAFHRQLPDRDDDLGLDQRELHLEPARAVGQLPAARPQVTALAAAGEALHHRRHVAERPEPLLLEAGRGQLLEQPPSGRAGERPAEHDLLLSRCLTDRHPTR